MEASLTVQGARPLPRTYRTPPLIEVVCEIAFSPAGAWDWTIPGLIYANIGAEFPIKREQRLVEMQVPLQGQASAQPLVQNGVARMQFFSSDQLGAVQVGPNTLVVNRLPPYPGWASYRATVLSQLRHYVGVASPAGLARVALKYLNRIVIPTAQVEIDEFFVAKPGLPSDLQAPINSFFTSATMVYEAPPQQLKIALGSAQSPAATESHFAMELEVSGTPETLDDVGFGEWLDAAHNRIELAFDRSFTQRTHAEIFGETDD